MPTVILRDEVQRLVAAGAQLVEVLPAEEYATEKMKAEPTVHGAVISFERAPDGPSVLVSRVLPF